MLSNSKTSLPGNFGCIGKIPGFSSFSVSVCKNGNFPAFPVVFFLTPRTGFSKSSFGRPDPFRVFGFECCFSKSSKSDNVDGNFTKPDLFGSR
ncbi:hypothetical protein HK096_007585 [Nowakowskiella sp. JEL0078]|nr:hypothetical protein HK096_007585 [Nowakowskiella sp. JEL0078]